MEEPEMIYEDEPQEFLETEEIDRMPHNTEAEEAVLGAILINPDKYLDVAQIISEKDFYIHRHQWVWKAYAGLMDKGQAIDIQTVCEVLDAQGHLNEVGGKAFFLSLSAKTPSSMHAEAYAHIVAEKSTRRNLIQAAEKIQNMAFDGKTDLEHVMNGAEEAIFEVSEKHDRKDVLQISEVLGDVYDKIRDLYQKGDDVVGVPSGLIDLDRLLGGFQRSDLIIVAGRPGMGKTGFMLTVLNHVALNAGMHVAIFSLEMSNEQLVHRLISQRTGISTQLLRTGKLHEDQLPGFVQAIDLLGSAKVFLDDTPAITPMQLRTKCRRLHMEQHLDLIIIDYLQLMTGDTGTDNRAQEVSGISRNLKILARELNVPVLTAAQLSRGVEQRSDKTPMLSDLRESGSLEQDADIVMFLHNPDAGTNQNTQTENIMLTKLIVAKHRHGPIGDIDLIFRKDQAKFESAARIMGD